MTPPVDILLATYNGVAGLPEQLASLERQTHDAWRLIARDDGSSDGTPDLLAAFAERHPGRVEIVSDGLGNLRTSGNFAALLARSTAPYCGFCDQDDIWDPEKLAVAVAAMGTLEAEDGPERPLLAVTDRRIIGADGTPLAASFWRNQGAHPAAVDPRVGFFVYPCAAGSSMLMNGALRALALPIPPEAIQYDCWIELVAAQFGQTVYVDEARLTYVRHAGNVSGGGRAYGANRYLRRARALAGNLRRQRGVYRRYLAQARAFLARYGPQMAAEDRARLEALVAMEGAVSPRTWLRAWRSGTLPPGLERKLAFLLLA